MLILRDLEFLGCLTAMAPRSVSSRWHFLAVSTCRVASGPAATGP